MKVGRFFNPGGVDTSGTGTTLKSRPFKYSPAPIPLLAIKTPANQYPRGSTLIGMRKKSGSLSGNNLFDIGAHLRGLPFYALQQLELCPSPHEVVFRIPGFVVGVAVQVIP